MSDRELLVHVGVLHDRKGIELCLPNDVVSLDLSEARAVVDNLRIGIALAEQTEPPAPAPLKIPGLTASVGEEFATCGDCQNGYTCEVVVAGAELYIRDAIALRDWLNAVLKFHSKKSCLEDEMPTGKAENA